MANILSETFSVRSPHHIQTNQQTCNPNLLTGFYTTRVPTKGASARVEGVSERILAINDTYMINTVAIVVKRFGTSSKHSTHSPEKKLRLS